MVERAQQTDRTRKAIIEAATDMMFGSASPSDVTMQNIADAAGVSHRTLYRYFESRRDLVEAVGTNYDAQLEDSMLTEILESFDAWTGSVPAIIGFGAAHQETFRPMMAFTVLNDEWRSDRDRQYWRLFRDRFPHLPEQQAREDFAVLRHVLWSMNAFVIGHRFELAADEVATGIERAVGVLVESIDARDRAAAEEGGGP